MSYSTEPKESSKPYAIYHISFPILLYRCYPSCTSQVRTKNRKHIDLGCWKQFDEETITKVWTGLRRPQVRLRYTGTNHSKKPSPLYTWRGRIGKGMVRFRWEWQLWMRLPSPQFSSVKLLSHVRLFVTPWTIAHQASLSITNSRSLLKLTSIKSVIPSSHLILCHPLLLLPSIFPSIRVFSNESVIHIRWPKYWRFSVNISTSNEYSGLISFRTDWLDLLAVQGTLKSLLQHDRSKATILRHLPLVAVINIARNIILRQGGSVCMDGRVEVGDGWGWGRGG